MKKLISLILFLCAACMLVSAAADADVTGSWYLKTMIMNGTEYDAAGMGYVMTLVLNEDGSARLSMVGTGEGDGTWSLDGDKLSVNVGGDPISGVVADNTITLVEEEQSMILTREAVTAITAAGVKAAASAEDFYGDWTCVYLENSGIIVNITTVPDSGVPNLKIGEGVFEFVSVSEHDADTAAGLNMYRLAGTFTDGVLALATAPSEADPTGIFSLSGKVEMLEDGMIRFTLDTDFPPLYYAPAAAE